MADDSFLNDLESELDEVWREEIKKRIKELDSGPFRAIPCAEVQARLGSRAKLEEAVVVPGLECLDA